MKKNYHIILISLIAILSFTLNFYAISKYGYGNEYYAAAVLSMTKSFKNFFFVSFDPSSMVSVDKPPLGLWIQAICVMLFGYSGETLIFPQAICGSLSCILIYILVNEYYNKVSAILSSLFFATTPIVVAVCRNNTMDMQLIFVLLLSSHFLFKSLKSHKWRYLFVSGFLIGIGFNIKMLQAYLVLPAFCLVYLIFAKETIRNRFISCEIALVIMLVVSLSWVTIVELTPSSDRPYIDSSYSNSVYELILGHNGIERIVGINLSDMKNNLQTDSSIGQPSIYRLWINSMYCQGSWLLLLSIISILTCIKKIKIRRSVIKDAFFYFWVIWLLTTAIFFSCAVFYHRYYLCMMSPAISILCGIGIPNIINEFKSKNSWRQYIFPVSLIITMIFEISHISAYKSLPSFLLPLMLIFTIICLTFIIIYYKKNNFLYIRISSISMIIAILIAPLYWCLTLLVYVPNLTKPAVDFNIASNENIDISNTTSNINNILNPSLKLENYLLKNYKPGSFLVVAYRSSDVAKFIIDTGLPCYAYGGFMGFDNTLTLDKLKSYVKQGKITYFLISDDDMNNSDIINYVKRNAKLINDSEYRTFNKINMPSKIISNNKLYYFDTFKVCA